MKFLLKPLYNVYRALLRNSKYRWFAILASLLYLVSPIDFVTDVFPVVGWIDDGLVATLLITEVSQLLLDKRKERKSAANQTQAHSVA